MNLEFSYIDLPGLAPDESGVKINNADQYAAVRLTRPSGLAPSMFGFTACAFAIEFDGSPTLTGDIRTIEGHHTVSCPRGELLLNGSLSLEKAASLKEAAIRGALSEMMSTITTEQAFVELSI